jgi:hypothetical protein
MSYEMFCNIANFYGEDFFNTLPNPQAGGPLRIGCQQLLVKFIRSYPAHLEAVPPSAI